MLNTAHSCFLWLLWLFFAFCSHFHSFTHCPLRGILYGFSDLPLKSGLVTSLTPNLCNPHAQSTSTTWHQGLLPVWTDLKTPLGYGYSGLFVLGAWEQWNKSQGSSFLSSSCYSRRLRCCLQNKGLHLSSFNIFGGNLANSWDAFKASFLVSWGKALGFFLMLIFQ